jgi:hypothetical protein
MLGAPKYTVNRGQVGGVNCVGGWDWGSAGVRLFSLTPTFRVGAQVGRMLELL